jgi:lipid-A-disaccharide synthase
MLVILPFETELYRQGGVPCAFVGHPLYEHLERDVPARSAPPPPGDALRIGILPGSRRAEVRGVLPQMLAAARSVAEDPGGVEFVLPYRRAELAGEIRGILDRHGEGLHVQCVEGKTHEVMRDLSLAMVASGTASLELAYYGVPMAVFYRIGRLSAVLKRFALITPHVALVNIVAGRRIVPEYVGARSFAGPAAKVLRTWLEDGTARERVRSDLLEVRSRLLFAGVAERTAGWVLDPQPATRVPRMS